MVKVSRQYPYFVQYLMKCGVWAMGINLLFHSFATSCQTHPSEYAYHSDSVNRTESGSANYRRYPADPASQEEYIHCDGLQLQLTDSNLGPDKSCIRVVSIISGLLGVTQSCCSYSPQESPRLPSH